MLLFAVFCGKIAHEIEEMSRVANIEGCVMCVSLHKKQLSCFSSYVLGSQMYSKGLS